MAIDPYPIEASGGSPAYSGQDLRLVSVAPFVAGAGASLGVRSGVVPKGSGTELLVQAQSTPDMTVKVQPGIVVLQSAVSTSQGAYTWALDTVKTPLTIGAAHASLTRIDLVVVRLRDANVDTSGGRDCDVIVYPGTPGGGVPSLPTDATYFTLAQVTVAAAVTSITSGAITDKRQFTAGISAIECTSSTMPAASSVAPGQLLYVSNYPSLSRLLYSDGSAWQYVNPTGQSVPNQSTDATAGTVTSTSYTDTLAGTSTLSTTFTAPPSGRVLLIVNALMQNSGGNVYSSWRLSGASTVAAADDWAVVVSGANAQRGSASRLWTGLTAGGSYTATMQHRVSAGTGTVDDRILIVVPLP